MSKALVDLIYEAAFVPELWADVLTDLKAMLGSASGGLMVFDGIKPLGYRATELTKPVLGKFIDTGAWQQSERIQYFQAHPFVGFVSATDYFPPELLAREDIHNDLVDLGLGTQLGTIIPMPSGELVAFIFDRAAAIGPHDRAEVAAVEGFLPHLARAGLIAARLSLEHARNTVTTFETIGLPAAVLSAGGRVLAANQLLEAMSSVFFPVAHGGMAISAPQANVLFQEAILEVQRHYGPTVLSIPVPARDDRLALVIHVLPLRRAAHDIFSGGETLIAATQVSASLMVPSPSILTGLFDLTPAEARLAVALTSGHSLKVAAGLQTITFATARTHLERVFRKTGTRQQSELVALLKSAHPLASG
jgi:DNA-binding CsgD family transcriptional regulator